jgi:hypothetical protein
MAKSNNLDVGRISGSAKAIWTLVTVGVSIVTAIGSTAIYVHDLIGRVTTLEVQANTMSQQLKRVSAVTTKPADFNGNATPQCDNGSFMVGTRFGVDPNLNPHGTILCAKVQPAVE